MKKGFYAVFTNSNNPSEAGPNGEHTNLKSLISHC